MLALAGLVVLVLAAEALAGNGGFAPPDARSPNASRINDAYWLIFGFTSAVFVIVEGALVGFAVRFRRGRRSRAAEGPQIRGHARLEAIWTVVPVLILAAIAAFVFYKLPGIRDTPAAQAQGRSLQVTVEGHQFYWEFRYPNGVVAVDRLRAPVGRVVELKLVTPVDDVIHSWWIPSLGGKTDLIPGKTNHTWFQADRTGVYEGQCAEFCGLQHAAMLATVEVMPAGEFVTWLVNEGKAQAAGTSQLGAETWAGACAKCHGPRAEGLVGPRLAGSPLLSDPRGLETVVREGRGRMPPVGQTWDARQMDALAAYVKERFGPGGTTNGG